MYWRVRKINPEDLAKQYGVHVLLLVSLLLNGLLFISRPKKNTMSESMKNDFGAFAKQVTGHLLDTSYITYMDSTQQLAHELDGPVQKYLRQTGTLASNEQELRAINLELQKSRQVSAVRFDKVEVHDATPNHLVPVDVSGVVAIHSADESGPTHPQPFHFRYLMGAHKETQKPLVAQFQEVPEGQPQAEQQE